MTKTMNGADYDRWRERNKRENAGRELSPGDRIKDCYWRESTIQSVTLPDAADIEGHGTITSIDDAGETIHYAATNWQTNFRVIPASTAEAA